MITSVFLSIGLVGAAYTSKPLPIADFKDLVAFGDSYTEESYVNRSNEADGGHPWPRFVADYSGATLHDFAVGGAICSDVYVDPTLLGRSRELEDQIPKWLNTSNATNLDSSSTVYSNWIGTNDLGIDGFLQTDEPAGYNITSFIDCNWDVIDMIYANGGRYFVIMNEAPLQLNSLYSPIGDGGVGDDHYWVNKEDYNTTQMSRIIMEYTLLVNTGYAYGIPYNLIVQDRWPGSTVVLFDVHSLITDIHDNPTAYLASPANVTGGWQNCNVNSTVCTNSTEPQDSFLWFDELHPSQVTDEIIARTFVDIVKYGNSSYATYWSSNSPSY